MTSHDYLVLGNRPANVGRFFGTLAVILAPLATWLIGWLTPLLANAGFIFAHVAVFTVSAGLLYNLMLWAFNRWIWRWGWVARFVKVPELEGDWLVEGRNLAGHDAWTGTLHIRQKWDRILVTLTTPRSSSFSDSATLVTLPGLGVKLIYSYRNDPAVDAKELNMHAGFCSLIFSTDRQGADGHYSNHPRRLSHGTIRLTRIQEQRA